jgi:hypothetical protein
MQPEYLESQLNIGDEIYLKIWEMEQEHARTRWTVVTFFMSVSFAIFGFSFQEKLSSEAFAIRLGSLLIFWFSYILLLHFYRFTRFLRSYLINMENLKRTSIDLESKATEAIGARKRLSTLGLIFGFGVIYTTGVVLLVLLGL